MKKRTYASFTQKLILYLLLTIFVISGLIFISIYSTFRKFIYDNACYQADCIATNITRTLKRKVSEIERIPRLLTAYWGDPDSTQIAEFPSKILVSYPFLTSCCYYTLSVDPTLSQRRPVQADRLDSNTIQTNFLPSVNVQDSSYIIRMNAQQGYWIIKKLNADSTLISYRAVIHQNYSPRSCEIIEFNFPIDHLTNFINDIKLFDSGYAFITDEQGNFLYHPNPDIYQYQNLHTYCQQTNIQYEELAKNSQNSGYGTIEKQDHEFYVYYKTIPLLHWQIGMICPYEEILMSSNKFCILLFIILGSGFLFLFWFLVRIVKQSLLPLTEFTKNAKKITLGQWYTELPSASNNCELQELQDTFKYMQDNIVTYIRQLKQTTAENEKIITELNLARKIQQRFLPKPIELPQNIELDGVLKQSRTVGGDLYDYFLIEHKLYFTIGDVSGKGFPAALYMASIVKLFRYIASRLDSTAEICNIINTHMCDNNEDDMYITMIIGILDINTGIITFTNAGHPKPIIIHPNGQFNTLNKNTDVPIGVLENYQYQEHTYTLKKDCQILLITDGITDAEDSKEQFFGQAQFTACIAHAQSNTPHCLVSEILTAIQNHIQDAEQSDDLTVMSILYKGIPGKNQFTS